MSDGLECLHLHGGQECGRHGECLISQNETSTCLCDNGWSKSPEMAVYFLPLDQIPLIGACNRNNNLDLALYWLLLILSIACAILQLSILTRISQLKRLSVFIFTLFMTIFLCIYRLTHVHKALIGVDMIFTTILSIILAFTFISTLIYFDRYLKYLIKCVHSKKALRRGRILKRLLPVFAAFDILTYIQAPLSILLLKMSRANGEEVEGISLARKMMKSALGMTLLRAGSLVILCEITFYHTYYDMKFVHEHLSGNERSARDVKALERSMRAMTMVRGYLWALQIGWAVIAIFGLFDDAFLYNFGMVVPVYHGSFLASNLVGIIPRRTGKGNRHAQRGRVNIRTTSDNNVSTVNNDLLSKNV